MYNQVSKQYTYSKYKIGITFVYCCCTYHYFDTLCITITIHMAKIHPSCVSEVEKENSNQGHPDTLIQTTRHTREGERKEGKHYFDAVNKWITGKYMIRQINLCMWQLHKLQYYLCKTYNSHCYHITPRVLFWWLVAPSPSSQRKYTTFALLMRT